ncbi:MAG TPA: thermonuclease family protein [Amphiplicatus sp.]|nr:thermonuclease family protein [Amphiplicatus sp.]
MRRRKFPIASGAAIISPPALASGAREVLSGDAFRQGEEEFRFADILSPSLAAAAGKPPPFAYEARDILAGLARNIVAIEDAAPKDRWGRRVIRATDRNGVRIEEELLKRGAARVYPETEDFEVIRRLLAAESEAREAGRGLWAIPLYRVRDAARPEDCEDAVGGYHLVEGIGVGAGKGGSRVYLNFGEDYRTDVTASATSTIARRWKSAGTIDLESLGGARLRVRGFVSPVNGPSIELTHPMQVELL